MRAWITPGIPPRSVRRTLSQKVLPSPLARKTATGGRKRARRMVTSFMCPTALQHPHHRLIPERGRRQQGFVWETGRAKCIRVTFLARISYRKEPLPVSCGKRLCALARLLNLRGFSEGFGRVTAFDFPRHPGPWIETLFCEDSHPDDADVARLAMLEGCIRPGDFGKAKLSHR